MMWATINLFSWLLGYIRYRFLRPWWCDGWSDRTCKKRQLQRFTVFTMVDYGCTLRGSTTSTNLRFSSSWNTDTTLLPSSRRIRMLMASRLDSRGFFGFLSMKKLQLCMPWEGFQSVWSRSNHHHQIAGRNQNIVQKKSTTPIENSPLWGIVD